MQIIVIEHPAARRRLGETLHRVGWNHTTILVYADPIGSFPFRYPHQLPLSKVPFLCEPEYKEAPSLRGYRVDPGSPELSEVIVTPEMFRQASRIINACDLDGRGAAAFERVMDWGYDNVPRPRVAWMKITSYHEPDLDQALAQIQEWGGEDARRLTDWGQTKRYFDYNWNINALPALGQALQAAGCPSGATISKYGLQLLYRLRTESFFHEAAVVMAMERWTGTRPGRTTSLGSPSSYATILEQLEKAELTGRFPKNIVLTPKALHFLTSLHPNCKDTDLPFRLDAWCEAGLEVSKPAMDRYIKTFFGKQKRFARV